MIDRVLTCETLEGEQQPIWKITKDTICDLGLRMVMMKVNTYDVSLIFCRTSARIIESVSGNNMFLNYT